MTSDLHAQREDCRARAHGADEAVGRAEGLNELNDDAPRIEQLHREDDRLRKVDLRAKSDEARVIK